MVSGIVTFLVFIVQLFRSGDFSPEQQNSVVILCQIKYLFAWISVFWAKITYSSQNLIFFGVFKFINSSNNPLILTPQNSLKCCC